MKIKRCLKYKFHSFHLGFDRCYRAFELSFVRACRYSSRWLRVVFEGFKKFDWVSYTGGHHDKGNKKSSQKVCQEVYCGKE